MASGSGTAVINFGGGNNEASVAVTGQASIQTTSKAEAFIMADDTSTDHTAGDHRYAAALVGFSCSTPSAGVGFTIYGRCLERLSGTFTLRWVWAD